MCEWEKTKFNLPLAEVFECVEDVVIDVMAVLLSSLIVFLILLVLALLAAFTNNV